MIITDPYESIPPDNWFWTVYPVMRIHAQYIAAVIWGCAFALLIKGWRLFIPVLLFCLLQAVAVQYVTGGRLFSPKSGSYVMEVTNG